MIVSGTKRPRNVDARRAAAILYGDWGTSKAYVVGLAFAIAGYSSFGLIAAMCLLTALVGINYIIICRHYPDGGGVYASVRHRSEIISIVGAFMLIADYIVTAALSALSAFEYLGVPHPEKFAALAILVIGALNWFGPRHTGGLAFLVTIPTVVVVFLLGILSIPHLGEAWHNLQPMQGGLGQAWVGFTGIVLALSGVEAIANSTGVMRLNTGSTDDKPMVTQTSTRALVWVMVEVCIFTALLGLAMNALPGLHITAAGSATGAQVSAPGNEGVRDYMLRYMGEVFAGQIFGASVGEAFGFAVSLVFGTLLLSAVNTAIGALIGIQFLLSRDGEIPRGMQKLNSFGVPVLPIVASTIVPALLVIAVKDVSGLADLYAVGVVGAIAVNLGATASDSKLDLKKWQRVLMAFTFFIMMSIELTLFVEKPKARVFVATLLAIGLILRGIAREWEQKNRPASAMVSPTTGDTVHIASTMEVEGEPMMCAVRGIGRTLDFAISEAQNTRRPLYLLFIREQPVVTPQDQGRRWQQDPEASNIFNCATDRAKGHPVRFCYIVSDAPAETIVDIAATLGVERIILGSPRGGSFVNMLRGNIIKQVVKILPDEIHLLVHA